MFSFRCSKRLFSVPSYFRQFSSVPPQYKERKVKVLDAEINVIESTENAANAPAVFYLPGAFGSIEMDFKPIFHEFNREKYKWISWDPPGFGKSRPPRREFVSKTYESVNQLDVKYIKELMNMIGYEKYTLLAWSGAAISGIIIAAEEPERVTGLITWGAFGFVAPDSLPCLKMLKKQGLEGIPPTRKSQLLDMYGEEYLLEMWNGWCDEAVRFVGSETFKKGGTFQNVINSVKCPALIIHGMKDALCDYTKAEHLKEHLRNSKLHVIQNGTHNLHLKETKEFVQCVHQFLDDVTSQSQ